MQLYMTKRNLIIFFSILSLLTAFLTSQTYTALQQAAMRSKGQTTPEQFGTIGETPAIIGQDKLLAVGMTDTQIRSLQDELIRYAVNLPDDTLIKTITIDTSSIKVIHDRTTGLTNYAFTITDNTPSTQAVTVETSSIDNVSITIKQADTVIYSSYSDM